MTDSNDEKAERLIGTKAFPAGLSQVCQMALEAQAYHVQEPYPGWYFRDWRVEERGPLPRCMPVARRIVTRGAKWLFANSPTLSCAENAKLEGFARRTMRENRMASRLPAMAERAGVEGGVALKFDFDASRVGKTVNIDALSVVDQVRLYFDAHDSDLLLMARVQYPYFDAAEGAVYWHREEWTAKERVVYAPVADLSLGGQFGMGSWREADGVEDWAVMAREENPFGVIPILYVKNIEVLDVWGVGDLWTLYRVIDRINLTYHLMDRSNQFDSETNPIFQDLEVADDDLNVRQQPGQPMVVESKEGAGGESKRGQVYFPRSGNNLRPAMMDYAKDLRLMVSSAAGNVDFDPGDVTNKGNLTSAVLTQLYQPQIEMTNLKRQSWGENGLTAFFALMARGLANAGVMDLDCDFGDEATFAVGVEWAPYFGVAESENVNKAA